MFVGADGDAELELDAVPLGAAELGVVELGVVELGVVEVGVVEVGVVEVGVVELGVKAEFWSADGLAVELPPPPHPVNSKAPRSRAGRGNTTKRRVEVLMGMTVSSLGELLAIRPMRAQQA
ncbi:MAG: hypothetical protein B7X36_09600 [Thiomonas sp. 14-64-326]|nr:MAG: hypothetical protein B7X36_09600 [Thiomonas sp. 14-64-326]